MSVQACVLYTAAIQPFIANPGIVCDPVAREQEYIDAIVYNVANVARCNGTVRQYVVENSDWDTSRLSEAIAPMGAKVIKTHRSAESVQRGKGYAELEMITQAVSMIEPATIYVKITGRLRVQNIQQICKRVIQCSMTQSPEFIINLGWAMRLADTRCFAFSAKGADMLSEILPHVDDRNGAWLEKNVCAFFWHGVGRGSSCLLLPMLPDYRGRSGATGTAYNHANGGKQLAHKLLKHVWFPLFAAVVRYRSKASDK